MKKLLLALGMFMTSLSLFSQTFNTAELLKPNRFSSGINPVLENNCFGIRFHGGYGIRRNVDFNMKYGICKGSDYIGADLEWSLRKTRRMNLSVLTGAHYSGFSGLDLGLCASFPVNSYATIFSGIDSDINFNISQDRFFWLPLGIEISMSKQISFILEADIPMVEFAPGILGGGLVIYIN